VTMPVALPRFSERDLRASYEAHRLARPPRLWWGECPLGATPHRCPACQKVVSRGEISIVYHIGDATLALHTSCSRRRVPNSHWTHYDVAIVHAYERTVARHEAASTLRG
jgi:hypothetical protein